MLKTVIVSKTTFFAHALDAVLDRDEFDIVARHGEVTAFRAAGPMRAQHVDVMIVESAGVAPEPLFDVLKALHRRMPEMKSLVVAPNIDAHFLSHVFESGCAGCLPTSVPLKAIPHYLKLAADGQRILPDAAADLLQHLVRETTPPANAHALASRLTEREARVLGHLLRGAPNKQIAAKMKLPLTTVKGDVKSIMRKTGAPNRTALAVSAVKTGFFEPTEPIPCFA